MSYGINYAGNAAGGDAHIGKYSNEKVKESIIEVDEWYIDISPASKFDYLVRPEMIIDGNVHENRRLVKTKYAVSNNGSYAIGRRLENNVTSNTTSGSNGVISVDII